MPTETVIEKKPELAKAPEPAKEAEPSKTPAPTEFVIAWKSKNHDQQGQYKTRLPHGLAESLCGDLNRQHPFVHHWPKPAA